ncbi:MAG: RecX family transcriptional regulator [Clostridia bacterium]|nr:RecX family transcriptional regulator [Clostridia bacterium]
MDKILNIVPVSKGAEYLIRTTADSYTVTPADLKKLSVSEGDEIGDEIVEALEQCAMRLRCIKKAFDYLSYGDMSQKKLYMKLKKHFDKKLSSYVASLMVQRGYIDENARALYIAKELYHNSRFGKMRIKAKLFQQLFCKDAIDHAVDNLDADDDTDFENIEYLLEKKYGNGPLDRDEKQKAVAYLTRMGYTFDVINDYFRGL